MVFTDNLKRSLTLAIAAALFLVSLIPLLNRETANAYVLLGPREIRLSSSAPGNAPNSAGANVTYRVQFDVSTPATLQGVVVTFCANTPIIEDPDCALPAGFNLTGAGFANGNAGDIDVSGWTPAIEAHDNATTAANPNTFIISDGTGLATIAGTTVSFEVTGVTNPDAVNTTFYARIYTYDTAAAATGYTLADPNAVDDAIDAGGIAMSTAQQITVTSKVQERLTFCVYTFPIVGGVDTPADPVNDNNCQGKTGSSVILGDQNGVLDSSGPYVDKTAYFSVTTNASGSAAIRLKGDTLSNGVQTISAIGDTPALTANPAGSAEQFGFCAYEYGGTGLTVATSPVDYSGSGTGGAGCAATTQTAGLAGGTGGDGAASFALDTSPTGTTSLYGQLVATKPAGPYSTGRLAFIGNITDTTEPGIYTTTLTFVATGTY